MDILHPHSSVPGALALAMAAAAFAGPHKRERQPDDAEFTVNGQSITIPAAWSKCETPSDCVSVRASCEGVDIPISLSRRDETQARFDKACAHSNVRMLRVLVQRPLLCVHNRCEREGTLDLIGLELPADRPARDAGIADAGSSQ